MATLHIEDRGDADRNREDYFAIRALDTAGNEVYFNASYLASGFGRHHPGDAARGDGGV